MLKQFSAIAAIAMLPLSVAAEPVNPAGAAGHWIDQVWTLLDSATGAQTETVVSDAASGPSLVIVVGGVANTLSSSALGIGLSGLVVQDGRGNLAWQEQIGSDNSVTAVQIAPGGPLKEAGASSAGLLKTALMTDDGRGRVGTVFAGNVARQRQFGTELDSRVLQVGWENDGDTWQTGTEHAASIEQRGEYNTAWLDQLRSDADSALQQDGADNGVIVTQSTAGAVSEIIQTGEMNLAFVSQ